MVSCDPAEAAVRNVVRKRVTARFESAAEAHKVFEELRKAAPEDEKYMLAYEEEQVQKFFKNWPRVESLLADLDERAQLDIALAILDRLYLTLPAEQMEHLRAQIVLHTASQSCYRSGAAAAAKQSRI